MQRPRMIQVRQRQFWYINRTLKKVLRLKGYKAIELDIDNRHGLIPFFVTTARMEYVSAPLAAGNGIQDLNFMLGPVDLRHSSKYPNHDKCDPDSKWLIISRLSNRRYESANGRIKKGHLARSRHGFLVYIIDVACLHAVPIFFTGMVPLFQPQPSSLSGHDEL
ncbi:uncharacterized protein CIMG_11732 [Coccidioides immitis RS]|uniref:Uncharacterized protein n=1 Tax=Coccidioides immitis (strain RS) TaxID=246410 RepID=A0A0D8JTC9_COCIM|nr:uncharacterized protein CIMG_11732 [Coccidioides immitis RS]KJF60557.1 hypothetical protein CIMG_11732 [Coccidioides immitis RS]